MSARRTAAQFGVGVSSAIHWIALAKKGETTPRPQRWRRVLPVDAHEVIVVGLIDQRKDVTLNDWLSGFGRAFGADQPHRLKRAAPFDGSNVIVAAWRAFGLLG
jgi:transposase